MSDLEQKRRANVMFVLAMFVFLALWLAILITSVRERKTREPSNPLGNSSQIPVVLEARKS